MKQVTIIAIICLLALQVSAKIRFIQTSGKEYKRTHWEQVEVYITEKDVPVNVQKIGIMLCEGEDLRDMYKMFIKARKVASDYGATGIYILNEENNVLSSKKYDKEDKKSKITFVAVRAADTSIAK